MTPFPCPPLIPAIPEPRAAEPFSRQEMDATKAAFLQRADDLVRICGQAAAWRLFTALADTYGRAAAFRSDEAT